MDIRLPDNLRVQHFMATQITADDTCKAMKIFWVGDPADGPDPQVLHSGHNFLFYTNYTTGAVLDPDNTFGASTAGTLATDRDTADFTFGKFAAAVNASTNWRCVLLGVLDTDLIYDHSETTSGDACIDITDTANSAACTTNAGTSVYLDTSVVPVAKVCACIGLEAMDDQELWPGVARLQQSTFPKTDRERDIANLPAVGARVFQPIDRAAFLTYCFVSNTDAGANVVSSDYINIYAATQTDHRLLKSIAGPGNTNAGLTESNATTAELSVPIVTLNGERIVVQYVGTYMSISSPKMTISGGVGILR